MSKINFNKMDLEYGGDYYNKIVSKGNGLIYTKYINRPAAWFFTNKLYRYSPNSISLFAFFILITAFIIFPKISSNTEAIVLYLLVALNYVLDSVDGQVARLTKQGSPLGEWLDHSLDAIRLVLVNVFIINIILDANLSEAPRIVIFSCLVGQIGLYVVGILREMILDFDISKNIKETSRFAKFIFIALIPADYGIFVMIFLLSANPILLTYLYILFGIYNLCLLVATMFMIFRSAKLGKENSE